MTVPPQECPTRTTGPVCASSTRFVAATSSAREERGFWMAMTLSPLAWSRGMILFQLDPSAKAPCTSTTVGAGAVAGLVVGEAAGLALGAGGAAGLVLGAGGTAGFALGATGLLSAAGAWAWADLGRIE